MAVLAVQIVWPRPAELVASDQSELGLADLIFFLYDEHGQRVPRDVLIQVHVAVANLGTRKGVLSRAQLIDFLDISGQPKALPDVPMPLAGHVLSTRRVSTAGSGPELQLEQVGPPFVLEADDVVTLRFRARRGIDWSAQWTPETLRVFASHLDSEIRKCRVRLFYRRGSDLTSRDFVLDVSVEQQSEYVGEVLRIAQSPQLIAGITERSVME